jgi:opacity protein-like surface antigen
VFTLTLGAAYRINEHVTAFGGYSFLRQRVGRSSTLPDVDADQQRVRVGIQLGYPLAFDMPW